MLKIAHHIVVGAALFALCGLYGGAAWAQDEAISWETVRPDDDADVTPDSPLVESPKVHYHLEKVVIHGNRKTLRSVILRYLQIHPGDLFSAEDTTLEESKYRMLASGLFSAVSFELKKGSARGYVVLEIKVRERNTIVVRDLTVGMTRIAPHWDDVVPYGSIGVEERSFLGSGIQVGGTVAASKDQSAYRIYWRDDHFLDSKFGLHVQGQYAEAQEYFGNHYLPGPDEETTFGTYEVLDYRRAGLRLGTGYNLLSDYFFWFDLRFENILAEEPQTVEGTRYQTLVDDEPVAIGYLQPDDSVLSSFLFGFTRDTTNHPVLPYDGSVTRFSVELSHPLFASDYDFVKFQLSHTTYFPFGKRGQSISVGGQAGLISGNAPFFDQFFVGDYSAFVPDRQLGLNFSNLHPQILDTDISDMWYEDMALSLNTEWSRPIYRGSGFVYGINTFVRFGVYGLASTQHVDGKDIPVDLTGDFGLRIDTNVGIFSFSFASVLQLIPPIRKETTQ
ncbi:MAG: BamA/TamA family outer membrane protein [Deltaproteobacteria bacterium]|nr:BamA/TamA family outer membrane protein [Deltaproteobacteria bacterium]MBN2670746.1 BamA/TamA family outer membrane protein [Deltaproteobacteria bacterium]